MYQSPNIQAAIQQYNAVAELPRGYYVAEGNQHHPHSLEVRNERGTLGYLDSYPDIHTFHQAIVYNAGLNIARSMAWQHALDNALDDVLSKEVVRPHFIVSSSTMLTSAELHHLPRPKTPRLLSATIYMKRGPVILEAHPNNVSIGQIVAAICG